MNTSKAKVWVIDANDNVGTVIGADVAVPMPVPVVGAIQDIVEVMPPLPYGHKVALRDMPGGANVVKYGVVIGRLAAGVRRGEHVHVQNLQSLRGRGDLDR